MEFTEFVSKAGFAPHQQVDQPCATEVERPAPVRSRATSQVAAQPESAPHLVLDPARETFLPFVPDERAAPRSPVDRAASIRP